MSDVSKGEIENEQLLQAAARFLIRNRIQVPARILLEIHLPLTTVLHTAGLLFQPLLTPLIGVERTAVLSRLLADRKHAEKLIKLLEADAPG